MRANEFVNEGWFDDAKNKVKQRLPGIASTAGNLASKAGSAIASGASSVAKGVGNIANAMSPSVAQRSTQIFVKKFIDTYNATKNRQLQLKQPFDVGSFCQVYMQKFRWEPGELQDELNAAIQTNDINKVALVMDKIGSLNTVDPKAKGPELDMTPKPTQTTPPPPPPAPKMSFGGEPQDPNDPATAKLMALAKQQGKI